MTSIFQEIHESEIDFSITARCHAGFIVKIGSPVRAETSVGTLEEAESWLHRAALEHYPASVFAHRQGAVLARWRQISE